MAASKAAEARAVRHKGGDQADPLPAQDQAAHRATVARHKGMVDEGAAAEAPAVAAV